MLCLAVAPLCGPAQTQARRGSDIRAGWIDSAWVRTDSLLEMRYYPISDLQEYINASLIDKQVPDVITGQSTKRVVIVPDISKNDAAGMLRVIKTDSCRVFGIVPHPDYKDFLLMMIHPTKGVRRHTMWYMEVRWEE